MTRLLIILLLSSFSAMAQQQMPPANVVTANIEEGEVNPTSTMVGLVLFDRMSEVAGEKEGIISQHYFDTGLVVEKGDVLVELNTELLLQDISILRSQVSEADAEIQKLGNELKRLESLKKQSVASQSSYENTYYDLQAQKSRKATLIHRLERLQLEQEKSKVRAPFDGIVLERKKDLGDWLGHGDVVARLGSTSGVRAIIPVAERLMPYQQPGQEIEVTLPGINKKLTGKFSGWVPFAELRSKSVYMKIALPYEKGMVENMSAEVEIATARPSRMLLIPRAALLQRQDAPAVYTIKEGVAALIPIKILARVGDQIGIESEQLGSGMSLVVDGNDRLKPGQPVNIINN
jgi:RND family efflux transporter MFP subunit